MQNFNTILIVRTDNIGDLVLTTPVFSAIKKKYPNSNIIAWVTSYNYQVLENNPNIDYCFFYTKAKHVIGFYAKIKCQIDRLQKIYQVWRLKPDLVITFSPFRWDRNIWLKFLPAKMIITEQDAGWISENNKPILKSKKDLHQCQWNFSFLYKLGITNTTPKPSIYPNQNYIFQQNQKLQFNNQKLKIGIHISSRKPSQIWNIKNFSKLIQLLMIADYQIILFWSPGSSTNLMHPGDDEKAAELAKQYPSLLLVATSELSQLIAGIANIDVFICSDGGAMHLAAALDKKIIALFGDSSLINWRPWQSKHIAIQKTSYFVNDITVEEVYQKLKLLLSKNENCEITHR